MSSLPDGVYPYRRLISVFGRKQFNALCRSGLLRPIRRGWYAAGDAPAADVAAVARGGVISCVTALKRRGVWTPEDPGVHIRGNSAAVRTRKGPFCRQFRRPEPECDLVDDIPTALRHAARCLDDEGFIVVCDSILNRGLLSIDEIEYQFRDAPQRIRRLLDRCDGHSESGPETMARVRLRSRNIGLRIQVVIDGVGRVDLLIGDWLIVEIDGWEYHGNRPNFQTDRDRDNAALALGYYPLRFTYDDIVFRWENTEQTILAAVRAGVHMQSRLNRVPRSGSA